MESYPPAEEGPLETPVFKIPTALGELACHFLNTRIRLFSNPAFNHIEHLTDDNRLMALKPSQEVIDEMFEYEFPSLFLPYVDRATMEWLIESELEDLEGIEQNGLPEDL